MKSLIARIFGLYTPVQVEAEREKVAEEKRKFYKKTTLELQKRLVGLQIPKNTMVVRNLDTEEIIAQDGVWTRVPNDKEKVVITYK